MIFFLETERILETPSVTFPKRQKNTLVVFFGEAERISKELFSSKSRKNLGGRLIFFINGKKIKGSKCYFFLKGERFSGAHYFYP